MHSYSDHIFSDMKQESQAKWGISPRMINYYCSAGRIAGAEKMGKVWLIPKAAEKPIDGRYKKRGDRVDTNSNMRR